jgi:hypothetical protein
MIKTRDSFSEWNTPVLLKKEYGNIDSCPRSDDDGKVYLMHVFAHSFA